MRKTADRVRGAFTGHFRATHCSQDAPHYTWLSARLRHNSLRLVAPVSHLLDEKTEIPRGLRICHCLTNFSGFLLFPQGPGKLASWARPFWLCSCGGSRNSHWAAEGLLPSCSSLDQKMVLQACNVVWEENAFSHGPGDSRGSGL